MSKLKVENNLIFWVILLFFQEVIYPFFAGGGWGGGTQWRESNVESSKAKNQEKVVTQRSQATFECILAENFLEPVKDIYFQIQEAPNKVNERNYI